MTDLCRQAAARSGLPWRALLLDLRNHGKSAALNLKPPHTLAAAARDVIHLFQQATGGAAPAVLVGHSMGGKTALEVVRQLALQHAPPLGQPKQVGLGRARCKGACCEQPHTKTFIASCPGKPFTVLAEILPRQSASHSLSLPCLPCLRPHLLMPFVPVRTHPE